MSDETLKIVPIPPLITVLAYHEKEKGAPLTEEEVLTIRDGAICMALPKSEAAALAAARGYDDIALDRAWEEWRTVRLDLKL